MTDPRYPKPPFATQNQTPPGQSAGMQPPPSDEMSDYHGSSLLENKVALVTGGDSGIGRATAIAFAKEGADVAISYLSEKPDAEKTAQLIQDTGQRCLLLPGDLSEENHCTHIVNETVQKLGQLDILVNNHAMQRPTTAFEDITTEQWLATFTVNVHSFFWTTKAALPHLRRGAAIINTASVNGLRGNAVLIDYSATKGAIIAFTYALAQQLVGRGIRVNAVAPGPVWTPLIPSTFPPERTRKFGSHTLFERPAQPDEIAPSYVFLATERLSSYYSGEVLGPTGQVLPG